MRVIIGLGHPAHYHLFKNFIHHCKNQSIEHQVIILNKDVLENLLIEDGISYIKLLDKKESRSFFIKYKELRYANRSLKQIVNEFRPDLLIGSINQIAHIGWQKKIPSIFFAEDDFNATYIQALLIFPFIKTILTPESVDVGPFKYKQTKHNSFHELAYLHPNHFQPEKSKIRNILNNKHPYFILRFSSLQAYHDIGESGITREIANKIIHLLKPHGNVYISSEGELEKEFKSYRIPINPGDIHHALFYAQMLIGDSQTMTIEAAVLGTPVIRFSSFVGRLSCIEELENKYHLAYGFNTGQSALLLNKIEELLIIKNIKKEWQKRRKTLLQDKIDFSKFMIWFLENYPDSMKTMKEDPDYQNNFK